MKKAKTSGRRSYPRNKPTEPSNGRVVRIITQGEGTMLGEMLGKDGIIFIVRGQNGKTYRLVAAEIIL